MNETQKDYKQKVESSEPQEEQKKKLKKPVRKTQGQIIQETLGLAPNIIEDVERKLFIARFLDYFSEETLDFIFKNRAIDQYITQINAHMEYFGKSSEEEDKLLKQSFDSKNILDVVKKLKGKAEELATSKGIKTSLDKRLRKLTLLISIPLFVAIIGLSFIPFMYFFLFPLICVFCMVPQLIKGYAAKKWFQFKDQNKNQVFAENREDIMILKNFTGEVLDNIRRNLLEKKVPLQLIKFVLYSRDYESLKIINQQSIRGVNQYFYTFDYPPDVEPFPIPEALQQFQQPIFKHKEKTKKREKNFIVLTEMKGKDGIILSFVPTLKDALADDINDMLNECDFSKASNQFNKIIPNYTKNMGIYCVCGELAEISSVQVCNWRNEFKFYLFEGKECKCGEKVYALSLMDESIEIPEKLRKIFS